jgi:hypothetical protein
MRFLSPAAPLLGCIFGGALSLLIGLTYKRISSQVLISVIVSAAPAYFVAVWLSLNGVNLVRSLLHLENDYDIFGPLVFSCAGFFGAWILIVAIRLWLIRETAVQLLWKSAAWACVGSLLGCFSSLLRGAVGPIVWMIVGGDPHSQGAFVEIAFCSAFLIWQTGMAIAVAFMMPRMETLECLAGSPETRVTLGRLTVPGKIYFALIYIAAAVIAVLEIKDALR